MTVEQVYVMLVVHFLIFLVTLIGNNLILIIIYKNQEMKNFVNYLIANKTVAGMNTEHFFTQIFH